MCRLNVANNSGGFGLTLIPCMVTVFPEELAIAHPIVLSRGQPMRPMLSILGCFW